MARDPVLQLQKVAEEFLLGLGKYGHVDRGLAAGQDGAQRDHQNLPKIVPSGIDSARVLQRGEAVVEPLHRSLHRTATRGAERVGSVVTKAVRRLEPGASLRGRCLDQSSVSSASDEGVADGIARTPYGRYRVTVGVGS